MYDPTSEAHEFIGKDRSEALAKAVSFFGASEAELALSEVDASRASGIGTRYVLVAYRRDAGPPGRRPPERPSEGRRGEARRGGERGGEGRRGGRGEERRGDERRERGGRWRSEGEAVGGRERRAPEPPAETGPSVGTATTELGEIGKFVCGLIERMGMGPFEISESGESEGLIVIQVRGAATGRLTSGDGRAVDAIQLLANQASLRIGGDDASRVVLDVEGNADERESFLSRIAERAARRAKETGRPVALEAMSPKDRRTVHVALREVDGIATMSVGEGRYRQVVVVPDSAPEYEEAKRYEVQSHRETRD